MGASSTAELFVVQRDRSNLDDAVSAAKNADVVVIMAGLIATEGADMPTPELPYGQDTPARIHRHHLTMATYGNPA